MNKMTNDVTVLSGQYCMSCKFPFMGQPPGHPRDCERCLRTQESPKRQCPCCGKRVNGARAMRDHYTSEHKENAA